VHLKPQLHSADIKLMRPIPKHFTELNLYGRISTDGQTDGNGLERQREALEAEMLRQVGQMGVTFGETRWLVDSGLSAYHGHHLDRGEMGEFMARVKAGKVPQDSLFVCESVSRASRQGGFAMLAMVHTMLDAGLCVLVLQQGKLFNKDNVPKFLSVELAMYAELAREESLIKAEYARDNWSRIRARARAKPGEFVFTKECPRWLTVVDGRYQVIEEKAAAVRQIYALALDGYGVQKLVRYANENKLPVPGRSDSWHISLIKRVLENRAVIGEFQPHVDGEGGKRVPEGAPIENFYPAILDRDTFYAVRELKNKRADFPKRADANNHNYLLGLGVCECGGTWRWLNKNGPKQPGYSQYSCSNRERCFTECPKVNGRLFDHTFISWALSRVPEMLASGEDPRQARIMSVEAQLETVQKARSRLMKLVESGDDDVTADILPRLRELKDQQREHEAALAKLRTEAPPAGFTFDEAAEVFLPAFLDHWPEGTPEAEEAFRVRSLFKARVTQAVAAVIVSSDRKNVTVTLRNDTVDSFELPDPKEGFEPAELDDAGLDELAATRQRQLRQGQRISNVGLDHCAPRSLGPLRSRTIPTADNAG
jgi:DNA invertase Pin-like site-specific DNA recombinase